MTTTIAHHIGGNWVEGEGAPLLDVNPAFPGTVLAEGRHATPAQVDRAVEAAALAAPGWAATPFRSRAAVLVRAAAHIRAHADQWGRELSEEEGKTLAEGTGEVRRAADILDYAASEADRSTGELFDSPRAGERVLVVRKPIGVAGVITPFNFPIAIPAWKIAPALSYGNAVVWKPAEVVPLLAIRFAEALEAAGLPPGVLNLVHGGVEVGSRLVEHPGVNAVSFTGSTTVGRALIARCGALGKPVQTEMGGKNAAVVLADADLAAAAAQIVPGVFGATGQRCTSNTRLIADRAVAGDLLEEVVRLAGAITVGDPLDPATTMGPLVTATARDNVERAVADAVAAGARPLTGGEPYRDGMLAEGFFAGPSVLAAPGPELPLWRTEVFGPVLAALTADGPQEALAMANASDYGLSGAIFTRDVSTVLDAIDRFDVGVLHVNTNSAGADLHVPFGGEKGSGFGPKEQGRAPRDFYTRTTTVYLKG
ncbi:aldehyde dehydrogenase [Spongiactinospora gelatinilytica]|uniref:Aldehyde dehydrogenase n=1 Tax=Spongiactinospora gelatinilytica TaxID=2666298 RepID=A0A2W2GIG5_9ACTN|nr:aldehyde dehydrogenase family protein [Spongiactinospora gelatinilytica]PZG37120.1 aldehyde dehydrogenase [Spongiactinospora gelatinilytica]